jgi:GDP-L-fucose synthase
MADMDKQASIFIAGHRGLVGSALVRRLHADGFERFILRARDELDLRNQQAVEDFFSRARPDFVFLAAAKVGGIMANNHQRAEFVRDNLMIQTNVIDSAYRNGARKLLFLGSSCIYPKLCPQPIREDYLMTGPLEPTNAPYAVAKIAGISMCQAYRHQYGWNAIALMPTNLYGSGDNFDPTSSHVLPALIRKLHQAKEDGTDVTLWGSGAPRREFLHVDDLADAAVFLMQGYDSEDIINVGVGEDLSIKELAYLVADIVDFRGDIHWDSTKPDGTPRKLLDVSKLERLGWKAKIPLREGVDSTYQWYLDHALIGA